MIDRESSNDTIAAVSTPSGRGGIGIVRLSGPEAASIAAQLVQLRQPLEHARARLADVLDVPGKQAAPTPAAMQAALTRRWSPILLRPILTLPKILLKLQRTVRR